MIELPLGNLSFASLLPAVLIIVLVLGLGVLLALAVRATLRREQAEGGTAPDRSRWSREEVDHLENLLAAGKSLSDQLDEKSARLQELLARAERAAGSIAERDSNPATPQPMEGSNDGDSSPIDDLSQRIHRLADDGADPTQIAQQLGEQIGKVRLILALRKR